MFVQQKTIFVNGVIKTMDLNNPEVEAVCVSAGKIEALGKKSEILEYVKNVPHEVIDLALIPVLSIPIAIWICAHWHWNGFPAI